MAAVAGRQQDQICILDEGAREILCMMEQTEEVSGGDDRNPLEIALNITLILDKIFKYLPVNDLLQCSLVCRLWHGRARTILRDHKRCYVHPARVKSCADLIPLYVDLTRMTFPFYNGICINYVSWKIHNNDSCMDQAIPEEFTDEQLPLKYLKIEGIQGSCPPHCVAVNFVRKIVETKTLKELIITQSCALCYVYEPWRILFNREAILPFQVAQLPEQVVNHSQSLLRRFVSAAPYLLQLDCYVSPNNVVLFRQDRYEIIKKLRMDVSSFQDYIRCQRFAESQPKLVELWVENRTPVASMGYGGLLSWRSLEKMLVSSFETLKSVRMTIPVLVKLVDLGVPPLMNVTELFIDVGGHYEDRRSLALLRKFNFTKIFPRLTSVSLHSNRPTMLLEMDRTIDESTWVQPQLTSNIKHLSVEGPLFRIIGFFVHVFPNVISVDLEQGVASLATFQDIWKFWRKLERIRIGRNVRLTPGTLDEAFCGIDQDEVVEMQRKSDRFLKRVQLVPVYPALVHCHGLKRLEISSEFISGDKENASTFTKVSHHVAFRRLKNLDVVFY